MSLNLPHELMARRAFKEYLYYLLWLYWVSTASGAFLVGKEWQLLSRCDARASHCSETYLVVEHGLWGTRLSSCGAWF